MAAESLKHRPYYVYVLFRHDTAEPFYVGKGKGRRWEEHEMRSHGIVNPHKWAIIQLARKAGAEIPKIKVAEDLTEAEAFSVECAFISAIGRREYGGPLVNMSDGGEGQSGFSPSAETRQLISASSAKRVWPDDYSPEFVALAYNRNGTPHSDEAKEKNRQAHIGKKYSDETRALVSEALRNRGPISDETREKLRVWQVGRKRTDEARQAMRNGWARKNRDLLEKDQLNLFEE